MATQLLLNGRVYAELAPRAGAMLVLDGTIAWLGSTDTARTLDADSVVDLAGALVTPAFVDAHVDVAGLARASDLDRRTVLAQAAALGVACVQDVGARLDREPDGNVAGAPLPLVIEYGGPEHRRAGPVPVSPEASPERPSVVEETAATVGEGGQPRFTVRSPADVRAAADCLDAVARIHGRGRVIASTPRLEGFVSAPPATYQRLAEHGAVLVSPADTGREGAVPDAPEGVPPTDLAGLAGAGVPLALGSWQGEGRVSEPPEGAGSLARAGYQRSPWASVRAALYHDGGLGQRLSVRAAFRAHTMGGWRAARRSGMGELRPGSSATYAVWQAGETVVAAPDGRIQRWSTDPRSAVPGLPDLVDPEREPVCLRTVREGTTLFASPEVEVAGSGTSLTTRFR